MSVAIARADITMKVDIFPELSANTVAFISLEVDCHSAGSKLRKYIHFHRDLSAPVMSTDMSQVGVTLFPSFQ